MEDILTGVLFQNYDDYSSFKKKYFNNLSYISIPGESIKENIYNATLADKNYFSTKVASFINIFDKEIVDLLTYLSINIFFFEINEEISEVASQLLSILSQNNHLKGILITNDFQQWTYLLQLCDFHPNLTVSPILNGKLNEDIIWNSTLLSSIILPMKYFNENFIIKKEFENLMATFVEREIPTFIEYNFLNFDEIFKNLILFNTNIIRCPSFYSFQYPLQPLGFNLNSLTYETFESDRTKYDLYQDSIKKALIDKGEDSIIAIVGAGRGPIVDCAIKAGAKKIYVIEKNHSASLFLKKRVLNDWSSNIIFLEGDMRKIKLPEKIDILVSELLGGFGDNELSPECLIDFESNLSLNAISIPTSYTSILVPIMSQFLFFKAKNEGKLEQMIVTSTKAALLLSNPKECFKFIHPGENNFEGNIILEFISKYNGYIHGFSGWFNCVLYKDIIFSSDPINGTIGLNSWYPIYFPLPREIFIKENQQIIVSFKRKMDSKRVWYEWALLSPEITPISNCNGNTFSFSLY